MKEMCDFLRSSSIAKKFHLILPRRKKTWNGVRLDIILNPVIREVS